MKGKSVNNKIVHLLMGPALFAIILFVLPRGVFETLESRAAIATVVWMAYWWVSSCVDYAVTAFLPIALNAFFQMTEMKSVIANYASETILLLLGASILVVSWEKTGLDKRIAVSFLNMIGNNLRKQVIFWFVISMIMSAFLPNAVVCATIVPIAVSMLKYAGEEDISRSKIGSKILLTIVYAAGVGGLASPLGGAMNLVVVDYIQQISGVEYYYTDWVIKFLPIMLVLFISNVVFLVRDISKNDELSKSKEFFAEEYKNMGKMSLEEKTALILFILAAVLSFTRQFYQAVLPGLKPAYVFIIFAIFSFLIVDGEGDRLMMWKSVQSKIVWEMIYVFAGGLAAGTLINESGAAGFIGNYVSKMGLTGGFFTVLAILTLTILLSDVTSNTATAAVSVPIVISILQGINKDPLPYIYVASIGVNLSYMLPTSIRAIPVGYGLAPKYMFKEGWKLTIVVLALMSVFSYFLIIR